MIYDQSSNQILTLLMWDNIRAEVLHMLSLSSEREKVAMLEQ